MKKEIIIKQLPHNNKFLFMGYEFAKGEISKGDYVNVWCETLDTHKDDKSICDDMFTKFNVKRPENFAGHSLSVSDVVSIYDYETKKTTNYYCDCLGWELIELK